jgi:hypothetical protein
MQNWKLIKDIAPVSDFNRGEAYIPDLGFADNSHPKLKFNFTMLVRYRHPTTGTMTDGSRSMDGSEQFALKSVTRPQSNVVFTDVNYYNYRTKIATKTDPGTMTVVLYDDGRNKSYDFYNRYLQTISPATNKAALAAYENPMSVPFGQLSSIGALPDGAESGLIKEIRTYHHFFQRGVHLANEYIFANPKIQSMELDELNMSDSDINTITLVFTYDSVVQSVITNPKVDMT